MKKFSKVAGYKINKWKSVVFLELFEKKKFKWSHLQQQKKKNNKILRNKLNQRAERSLHWKLKDSHEGN